MRRVRLAAEGQEDTVRGHGAAAAFFCDREAGGEVAHGEPGLKDHAEPLRLLQKNVAHGGGVHGQGIDPSFLLPRQQAERMEEVQAVRQVEAVQDPVDQRGVPVVVPDGDVGIGQVAPPVARGQEFPAGFVEFLQNDDVHGGAFPLQRDRRGQAGRAAADDDSFHRNPSLL